MDDSEQLFYTAVRLECGVGDDILSFGTGYFFDFELAEKVPVIVTNRHVLENADWVQFRLNQKDADGKPDTEHEPFLFQFENNDLNVIEHPSDDVDLAVIFFGLALNRIQQAGKGEPFYRSFVKEHLATEAKLNELMAIENVLMVGCPNAVWDKHNNLPIIRQGISATPPFIDYDGRKEFIVDIPVFGGSSGSPIVLYDRNNSYRGKDGGIIFGSARFLLLGTLYAGERIISKGDVESVPIPSNTKLVAKTELMINLGACIKAERLLDFVPLIGERLNR